MVYFCQFLFKLIEIESINCFYSGTQAAGNYIFGYLGSALGYFEFQVVFLGAVAWQDKEAGAEQEVFLSEQVLVLAYVIQPLLQSAKISYLNKESVK